ncbi:MAG TPA: glycosyltransferase, partial [Hyphomonadaceae bacterium]|nr:glycosyltransferase [Hyphomonadaceae bacterium]
ARLLGFRVIATHHAADYDRAKWGRFGRWFLRSGEWMLARFANEVICVSSVIETNLARRHPQGRDRFVTIRNGAPSMPECAPTEEDLLRSLQLSPRGYILCVGRLDPSKAFHDAIEAFRVARPKGLKLVIVGGSLGSDRYAADLMASATDIVFTGALRSGDVRILYRNAALFVHPSYHEGFPIVVLEALAADAPMLLSDIPPHLEIGLDPACYFPKGDVRALAAALRIDDFSKLRPSRRVQILAENSWESVAHRHRDIFARRGRNRDSEVRAPAA